MKGFKRNSTLLKFFSSTNVIFIILLTAELSSGTTAINNSKEIRRCNHYSHDEPHEAGKEHDAEEITCAKESSFCFALWRMDLPSSAALSLIDKNLNESRTNNVDLEDLIGESNKQFIKQGCWEASPSNSCSPGTCIAYITKSELESDEQEEEYDDNDNDKLNNNNSIPTTVDGQKKKFAKDLNFFCCCSKDHCNMNVTVKVIEEEINMPSNKELSDLAAHGQYSQDQRTQSVITIVLGGGLFLLIITLAVAFIWRKRFNIMLGKSPKGPADPNLTSLEMDKNDDLEAGQRLIDVEEADLFKVNDPIILGEELAKGKFATVFSGQFGGNDKFALKVFAPEQRDFFENEKYIYYRISKLNHPNIVAYHGWQEYSNQNLILILNRVEPGNIRDFLTKIDEPSKALDLQTTIKILKGITEGLSFLHGNNKEELVICHRDLNSKNILIDADFNCYIADFGLSLVTHGSKYCFAGIEKQAEFSSLTEAGTARYMAPELLEGAVNLKDCENALKQADIYALALVLWEVCNLSKELSLQPIMHTLPYEKEIGKDISLEKLSSFVVSRRERPIFATWRKSPISRSLRDTLVESWDAEPEARLTALCIVQRLSDIASLVTAANNPSNSNLLKDLSESNTTPLETAPASPWIGRNQCLSRNLFDESTDERNNDYYVTSSEKHLMRPAIANSNGMANLLQFGIGGGGRSFSESFGSYTTTATANTELSGISTDTSGIGNLNSRRNQQQNQQHPLNTAVPPQGPTPIPFLQNNFQ